MNFIRVFSQRVASRICYPMMAMLVLATATTVWAGEDDAKETAYFELKPSLVSNVTGAAKYIRCDVQLMTEDPDKIPDLALHSPALRHELLMMFAGQDGGALMTPDGKDTLREKALEALREVLIKKTGTPIIAQLYFTSYYVQ